MRKQALRWLLGAGYVVLVTLLLLYQMGVMGKMRNSIVSVLGTLLLGIALAVVLVLYIRVTDQLQEQSRSVHQEAQKDILSKDSSGMEQLQTAQLQDESQVYEQRVRSYEEVYEDFLKVTKKSELSERELEVAWLLYRGYTNRQIGEELYIAETTVKKHVTHIYQKMEIYSRKDFREKMNRGM